MYLHLLYVSKSLCHWKRNLWILWRVLTSISSQQINSNIIAFNNAPVRRSQCNVSSELLMTLPPPIITQSVGENWQRWKFIIHDKLYNSGLCRVSDPVPRCPLRGNMIITLSHYYHATLCTPGVNNNTPIPPRPVIIAYLDKMHVIPLLWHNRTGFLGGS